MTILLMTDNGRKTDKNIKDSQKSGSKAVFTHSQRRLKPHNASTTSMCGHILGINH
jgi:hypothetical protein